MQPKTVVFVSPEKNGYPSVIDQFNPDTGKGLYSGQSEEEIRNRYPLIERRDLDEVIAFQENLMRTSPEMIPEDSWMSALEALPPCNWIQTGTYETFAFAERYSGRITTLYARVGKTYWKFLDICTLGHTMIIDRVLQEMQRRVPA